MIFFKNYSTTSRYLAKELDLRYSGSRMTVLTDQKETVDPNGRIVLRSIFSDNPSAACAACSVTQFEYGGLTLPRFHLGPIIVI